MKKYNIIEKKIATSLEYFPFVKYRLKLFYQFIMYLINAKKNKVYLNDKYNLKINAYGNAISFGGYYDKNLISKNRILYHSLDKENEKTVKICLNDNVIAESLSWNWQQGAMLSWYDENKIIYNNYINQKFSTIIKDTLNDKEIVISCPTYTFNSSGLGLSLNFRRLAKYRPDYGYTNESYQDLDDDKYDGIYLIDYAAKDYSLIVSLDFLKNNKPRLSMKGACHKVNHMMFNRSGDRFMFLHRWIKNGRKFSRLYTAKFDGSDLFLLADNNMVSHCNWIDNQNIIGWLNVDGKSSYYKLKDKSNKYSIIGGEFLDQDGHPSLSSDGKWVITDTYPDKARMQHLLLFNIEKNIIFNVGSFYSPLRFSGVKRCDLHPRFEKGNVISFDSAHSGKRKIYSLDISKLINDES